MKKKIILALSLSMFLCGIANESFAAKNYSAETPVKVREYTKKDGTHVNEYYRAKATKKLY